jgi:hypothetical protein
MLLPPPFSTITQTLIGYGDVYPLHPLLQLLANVQQVSGMFVGALILGQVMEQLKESHRLSMAGMGQLHSRSGAPLDQEEGRHSGCWGWVRSSYARMIAFPRLREFRRVVRRYLLLVIVVLETSNFVSLFIADPDIFARGSIQVAALAGTLAFQIAALCVVISVSLKYVRHADTVTLSFVLQSFLSACLCYAGIYVMMYCREPDTFHVGCSTCAAVGPANSTAAAGGAAALADPFWLTIIAFVYFSITSMTSTGFGDIYPQTPGARVVVCSQALVSVLYSVVILGMGLKSLGVGDRVRSGSFSEEAASLRGAPSATPGGDSEQRPALPAGLPVLARASVASSSSAAAATAAASYSAVDRGYQSGWTGASPPPKASSAPAFAPVSAFQSGAAAFHSVL